MLGSVAHADESDTFDAAMALEGQGKLAEAADALRRFGTTTTDDDLAADALAEAAELFETRLYDAPSALACWRALLAREPDSRVAPRARTRITALEQTLRGVTPTDIAALGQFSRLLDELPRPTTAETRARVTTFVREHPQLAIAGRAHEWLGQAAEESGAFDEAVREYDAARADGGALAARATRAEAELCLRRGKLERAAVLYDALAAYDDPVSRLAVADGKIGLTHARRLRRIAQAAIVFFVAFVVLTLWRARKTLWPPPIESRFLAPVALLFGLGSLTQQRAIVVAVSIIGAGSVIVSWLAGAAQRQRRSVLFALGTAIAISALVFLVVRATDLTQLVVETITMGPDR